MEELVEDLVEAMEVMGRLGRPTCICSRPVVYMQGCPAVREVGAGVVVELASLRALEALQAQGRLVYPRLWPAWEQGPVAQGQMAVMAVMGEGLVVLAERVEWVVQGAMGGALQASC